MKRLILDKSQREHWHARVETTIANYQGRGIVTPPTWADLDSGVSFVLAETDTIGGKAEALVSFWGSRSWRCTMAAGSLATSSMSASIRS